MTLASPRRTPRKRGRKPAPPPVQAVTDAGVAREIPIRRLRLRDAPFKFRVGKLRIGDLVRSMKKDGQQVPIIVRPVKGTNDYEVISGYRRAAAIQSIWGDDGRVNAVVRKDLDDDEKAVRVSVLENEIRKTYNDLDRANAMLAYRALGKSNAEIEELFQVGARQRARLESITTFPQALKDALVAEGAVDSTKAVRLMQYVGKYVADDDLPQWLEKWIGWIDSTDASLNKLNAALREELAGQRGAAPIEFFVEQVKDGKRSLRVRPISIDGTLSAKQRANLLADLGHLVEFVKGLG